MTNLAKVSHALLVQRVERRIIVIRGEKVMLDSALADLYGVTTKHLNQQVRRNAARFPPDFMFPLSDAEAENLRSQFVTSRGRHGGRRYTPLAFTEQGVAMLSSVLKSERAVQVNIAIMRARRTRTSRASSTSLSGSTTSILPWCSSRSVG